MQSPEARQCAVLVVDDELLIRMFACDLLADRGFKTIEAERGDEALAILDEHPEISVLLTDINMPGRPDGIGLAHDARGRRPDLRIVVTFGRIIPHCSELPPGSCFVAKPNTGSQLLDGIGPRDQRQPWK